MAGEEETVEYHSRDFEWEELRREVEIDPSLRYHLEPFESSPSPLAGGGADAWQSFHRRHCAGKFFKERRYLLKEFPEILQYCGFAKVLEVGCGNGSTVLPLLRAKQNMVVYACDCSQEIIEKAKEIIATVDGVMVEQRFHPFLLDVSLNRFPKWLSCASCRTASKTNPHNISSDPRGNSTISNDVPLSGPPCCIGGVDFVTLIFTLSAIPFQKMSAVVAECFSVLKRGGLLLLRDYGLYDMTMLRFPPEQKVGLREYRRLDGTLSCFFSLDIVRDLFVGAGFIELELEYCCVMSVNRRNGKKMRRVWVHGKFKKPT